VCASLSLVECWNNDYSVPTRYGHHEVFSQGLCRTGLKLSVIGVVIATHIPQL
jgi:hypothetical protein